MKAVRSLWSSRVLLLDLLWSDWSKAESLVKIELQADVELIRSSTRGFSASNSESW
ncbi:unnamed protein product [Brassica oleracea var. botrytis]